MDKSDPIKIVTDFTLADEIRLARKRTPSDFKTILNLSNSLSDGLKVRRGYGAYTDIVWPVVNGVSLDATSLNVPIVCGIDVPEKEDVHLLCMATTPEVWMYPYWIGSTRQNASMALAESLVESLTFGNLFFFPDVSFPTAVTMKILSWTNRYSTKTTTDYFKGWKLHNTTQDESTIIISSLYDSGTDSMTFTCTDTINATGLNWLTADVYKFYHSYHDNTDFIPTFNGGTDNLSDPPCGISDNSMIFFSGGQGADSNLRGSIIYSRMNKTFFEDVSSGGFDREFTIDGTYVGEEECRAYDLLDPALTTALSVDYTFTWTTASSTSPKILEMDKTYWVAIAPIYDGGIIGELQRYETPSKYYIAAGAGENVNVSGYVYLNARLKIYAGSLNKTIQGFAIYMAQDSGDTRASGRQTPYYYVGQISVVGGLTEVETDDATAGWTHSTDHYRYNFNLTGAMWEAKGNTYETDTGMAEIQSDTNYSYSGRRVVGGRHFIYNAYLDSLEFNDRQNIFTNPTGQNASINSGIPQRRLFPNEEGYYRIRVVPDVGSRINGLVPRGFDEFLVLKERGVISCRIVETNDLIPELISNVVDHKIGCSTFNGYAVSNQEQIYFAGYDDCYVFNAGQLRPLIEREDKRDWLYTYREVLTNTQKENVVVIWLPQNFVIWDFAQTNGYQYILDSGGWSQAAFNQSSGLTSTEFFKFPCKLNNGAVLALGTISGGVAGAYGIRQFQNPSTGAFYSTDVGIAIKYQLDTDYFNFGHDKDFVLNKIIFNRTFNSTPSGQLDVSIYRDRVLVKVVTLDRTKYRTFMHMRPDDPKIGFEWRFIYNMNSSPELASSTQYQIDSIEIYGEIRSRSKRATEVTSVTDVMVWDVDSWDGGKSWGT